eukprot:3073359-Amphidinium_carterae.2
MTSCIGSRIEQQQQKEHLLSTCLVKQDWVSRVKVPNLQSHIFKTKQEVHLEEHAKKLMSRICT